MKKTFARIIAIALCMILCLSLVACGGGSNRYQQVMKKGTIARDINITEGETSREEPKHYYSLYGEYTTGTKRIFIADVTEKIIEPINNTANTAAFYKNMQIKVKYDYRDTVLEVYIYNYTYSTNVSTKPDSQYTWLDGISFKSAEVSPDRPLPTSVIKLDINKYFENGKLTVADVTETPVINVGTMSTDKVNAGASKYTEVNANWQDTVIEDALELTNKVLGEFDKVVDEKLGK